MHRLRVGFVGGGWSTCHRHLPAARADARIEVVGLVTQSPASTWYAPALVRRRFGLRQIGFSMAEPWLASDVDAVVIGTPPDTHYRLVMDALRLGKHVLVEKPFALSVDHAAEMARAAKEAGLVLAVVHNFQFARATQRARSLIARGALGEVRSVTGIQASNPARRLPPWIATLPMGLFTDEAPHLLYLLREFVGPAAPESIFVGPPLAASDPTPQVVGAHFAAHGRIGALNMTFASAVSEWHVILFGTRRTAIIDLFRDIMIELPDDDGHGSLEVMRTSWSALAGHLRGVFTSGIRHATRQLDYGNREVMRRFADAVLTGAPLEGISAGDGLAVVEMMAQFQDAGQG
jgi:scyllo-inositol 2-dehydrogenase (NADP+)